MSSSSIPDRNEVDERAVLADDADCAVAGTGGSMAVLMVDRSRDERSVCPATLVAASMRSRMRWE